MEIDFDREDENPFAKEDIQSLANYKIENFSNAFRRLSKSISVFREKEEQVTLTQMQSMFDDLSERICKNCVNCSYCWDKHYEETYHSIRSILQMASEQGVVDIADAEGRFERRCIRLEDYVDRLNENMQTVKNDLSMKNKMAEGREVFGSQMQEVASILGDFSKELSHVEGRSKEEKRMLVLALKQLGLQVKKISILERRGERLEVQFLGRVKGRNCITKRDVAAVLYKVLGRRFQGVGETKNVIGREYETILFSQDTNFKTLTGMAKVAKSGERISGDNFSFLELGTGELLMVLSDGMGSGESAFADSANLIEVLEDLLEVGFQKDSAIRMLNSFFVLSFEGKSFTTLDITSINLYTGECEFLKNGAAATFIKKDGRVETIFSNALPVGIDLQAKSTIQNTKLEDADMVIMVTDGVLDAFPGDDKEFYIENILENMQTNNPSEAANKILIQALERSAGQATDDMSVLAAGIWKKTYKKTR